MTWKLYLGAAGLLTATLFSLTGCGGNAEPTTSESLTATSSITNTSEFSQTDSRVPQNGSQPEFTPGETGRMQRENRNNSTITDNAAGFNWGERSRVPEIDYATAAATLEVTEDQLAEALNLDGNGPPDFSAAASTLGVTEEALMNALGFQGGMQPGGGLPPNDQGSGMPPGGPQNSN